MLLKPKKTKYTKYHTGKVRGTTLKNNKLNFGDYGIKSISNCRIHNYQIESARRVFLRKLRRKIDKIWIRIYPNIPITKKGLNSRMGKGKGSVDSWVYRVKKNTIIFEITALSIKDAYLACKAVSYKLPCKLVFIKKNENDTNII